MKKKKQIQYLRQIASWYLVFAMLVSLFAMPTKAEANQDDSKTLIEQKQSKETRQKIQGTNVSAKNEIDTKKGEEEQYASKLTRASVKIALDGAKNATPISLGKDTDVAIANAGDIAWLSFVPEESMVYIFSSRGTGDTCGELYDENMQMLLSDDDSGLSDNFKISYKLEAGKKYYFAARYYSSSANGKFTVRLDKRSVNPISLGLQVPAEISYPGEAAIFSYTAKKDQLVTFSSTTILDGSIGATVSTDSGFVSTISDTSGKAFSITLILKAKKTYYFSAEYQGSITDSFFVQLDEVELLPLTGMDEVSISATSGQGIGYFSYVPTKTGNVDFSSSSEISANAKMLNGDFALINSASGNPNFSFQHMLVKGQTYYLLVNYDNPSEAGTIAISIKEESITAVSLEENKSVAVENGQGGAWYEYTPDQACRIDFSSTDSQSARAAIYDTDMNLIASGSGDPEFSVTALLAAGKTYYFHTEPAYTSAETYEYVVQLKGFPIRSININEETNLTMEKQGEKAFFSYVADQTTIVDFVSYGQDATNGFLYDEGMEPLSSDYGWPNFSVQYVLQKGKTYYFMAAFNDEKHIGTLSLQLKASVPDELTLDTDVQAVIDSKYEVLWYSYTPVKEMWVSFTSFSNQTTHGVLYDSNMQMLNNDDWTLHREINFELAYKLEAGEQYYFSASYNSMASGRFTVRLNQIEMKDINLNGNMTATPPSRGASDWFVYRPEERQYIQFNSINSVAGTYGRIYDENMNAIEDRSGSNDIAINRMLEKDKTYYYSIKYYTSDITNDTTVRFNRLNVKEIEENQDIPVTIDNEENSEWYIYTPTKTQPFAFSSRSDIGNTSGIIYDAGLYALVSQNGNPEFHIEYILRANQTYLFSTKFINTDQTGNYSIKLEPKKANPISPDSDIAVDITKGGEHGWLSYTPTETEWYNFYSYSAGSNVALYDQNFNGLPYDYNYSAEAGVFISYKLYANKTYYFSAGYSSSSIKGTINAKLCKLDSTLLEMDKEMNAVIEERGMVALFIYTPTETEWARFTSDSQTDISYSQYYNYKDEDYIHSLDNRNTNDLKLYADRTYYFLLKYKDTSKTGTINFKLSEYIPTQINVGEKKPVSIEKKKENVWFSYTAAETGWVRLSSDSSDKVSCEIYNGNYYYHDYNYYDYYNQSTIYGTKQGNPNFSLAFYVTEGSTYYFPVRYQEENIGNFNIQLQKSLPEGNLENKYLQYNIHNRGSYSLGILKGDEENPYDDNKNMLYNHPNGTSSQTLLSVNGSTFFFHAEDSEIDGKQAIAVENYGDVEVKQTLSFAPNPLTGGREDIAYISYEMINHGSEIASLGGRILLDTMIGSNDGAPFQVNGNQVTVETEYSGDDVPQYWECFDKYVEPDMYANGTFYTDMYAIPDRVQFLGWSNLYNNNTFSYNVNNESYSDSSVAVYFNEQKIAPGQKRTFQTYYGIGKPAAVAENDDVVLSVTAPTSLRDNKKFEGRYDMNPFKITAYVQNKTSETMENVEIELNLPDTGELELEDGYVSLIKDIKIEPGSSANCSWDVFAFSQEEAIDIGYAVKLNYSPEKSLDLPLSINLGKVDPLVPRVVTYNLNYKGAETYTQEVENGFRLTKPEDPVREGYLFKGWYANKECSGDIDWFNQFAGVLSQKRILQNTTLYAKWEGLGSITQEDVFNFSSENEEFKKSITKLRPNYLKILKDALSSAEYELIEDKNKTIDHNRSFGMAAIIVLMKLGHLNPENYQDAATEINQLNLSQKNKQVAQIIEYYTLLQYLSYVNNTMLDFGKLNNEEKNAKTLAMFQTTNIPLVVSVASKSNEDELHMAVFKDENGLLQAWNPLAMEFQTLTLENGTCTLSGTEYNLTAVFDFTDDYFASKNPEEYSRNGGKQKDKAVKRQTKETATAAYLFTSHDTFTATHSNGETAKVTADGINGPLAISFLAKLSDSEYLYTVPILTGAETLSIEMPDEEWKLSYIYHDSQDGSLQSAAANLGGEAVIGSKGELVTILPQTAEQTLSSTLNQVDTAWNTVTVYGNSIGLSIKNSAQLGNIYNASTEKVTLELSNSYNILALPDLTIPQQGATISQEQGVDNQLYAVVRDPDGNELARQENTYSLSFYTMNASTVDTQSGLKSGEKAVRPADPVLAGFNFNGWITKGQTKWNFNQDVISGDTVLYATWIENRDLLHQITFRAEGNDDMIYRLLDGSSIAAEDMPAIPKRRGYTGIWDVDEIVSADRDVIVRAVYTRDYSVSGFVVSVEHGKGGTVNPAGEDLYENKLLAIQMTPEEGYFIGDVLVNGLSALKDVANNQLTLTLDRDYKVIVSFKRNIESASFSTIPNEIYTGTAIQPAFTLAYNREPLVLNTDYTVTYENNKNAGTADVIVTGIGTYGGNAVSHFTIEPKSITMEGVVAINRAYDGSNYVVLEGGKLVGLAEGDNVAFSLGSGYMTDAKVGNGKQVITDITLKGASKGNYSLIQPDDIKVDISAAAATVESVKITPDNVEGRRGEKIQFEATVEGKNDPSQDVKWNVSGNNSAATKINASGLLTIAGGETAQELIITAISELDQTKSGEAVVRLIEEQNLASASIMPIPDQVYTRSALEPEFTLSYEGNILQPGTDYSATYWNNTNAGTADILIIGKGAYTGTIIAHFTIKPKLIHISGVRAVDRTYDGKNRVTLEGGSLSGVIEGDNNAFSLGYGYMADAKAGNEKKVTTNIVLVGSLKNNYRLIQPDLKVNIYAKPSVSSVKITTKIASIGRGDKQPFAVKVEGLNNPSQKITWKLSGNKSKSTKINSSGLLTVSAREKAKKLTITAVSKLNTEKKT